MAVQTKNKVVPYYEQVANVLRNRIVNFEDPRADVVVVDCFSEGQLAAEHLVQHGHRDLFFIGNTVGIKPRRQNEADAELMLAGIQRALGLSHLAPIPAERIRFARSDPDEMAQAADWFMKLRPRPTAGVVFLGSACNNLMRALADRGFRCPQDVSLVSKTSVARRTEVTSLESDGRTIGELAFDALMERVSGKRPMPARIALPSRLRPGSTVQSLVQESADSVEGVAATRDSVIL